MTVHFSKTPNAADASHAGNTPVGVLANSSVSNIADATLTTITTFTATGDQSVSRIGGSGTFPAEYRLTLNAVDIEIQRSGPDYKVNFEFDGPLSLSTGDILDVKVTHLDPNNTRDFQATIYGV